MLIIITVLELLLLFILANRIANALYLLFWTIFKSKYVSSGILTFIYLPGTVVHEFAHLITAEILRVPTGQISFTPKITQTDNNQTEIGMGSVQVGNSDPIRKFLIGIAPIISGLATLLLLIWLWQHFYPQLDLSWHKIGLTVLIGYFLFAVSNNMFSSDSDIKEVWFLPILILLIIAAAYIVGIRIALTGKLLIFANQIFSGLTQALGIVIGINAVVLLFNLLILRNIFKKTRFI